MHSIKCNLNSATSSVSDFRMSRNLQEMHRSIGKITDENVLLFSSQTKFAAIIPFNADNHVISLSSGRKKSLHTVCHFETLLLLFFNMRYEQNCDFSNILKYFRNGAIFLVSMNPERSDYYILGAILGAIFIITFLNYSLTMSHFFGPMPNLLANPSITVGYIKE